MLIDQTTVIVVYLLNHHEFTKTKLHDQIYDVTLEIREEHFYGHMRDPDLRKLPKMYFLNHCNKNILVKNRLGNVVNQR